MFLVACVVLGVLVASALHLAAGAGPAGAPGASCRTCPCGLMVQVPAPVVAAAWWTGSARGGGKEAEVDSEDEERRENGLRIVIDTFDRTLSLYSGRRCLRRYPCAVGKPRTPSPVGEWTIVHKGWSWGGGFGSRWLGLNVPWGVYGIHGTNRPGSIGRAVSGGCIRMLNRNVEELFELVRIGTPVSIVGPRPGIRPRRAYRRGDAGRDVVFLQMDLRAAGFDAGAADGRFGPATEKAVRDLEAFYGLEEDGVVEECTRTIIGFPGR